MTKEQAQIRLDEIVKANQLFHKNSIPAGYRICEKQPQNEERYKDYLVCEPIYSQTELEEMQQLTIILLGDCSY